MYGRWSMYFAKLCLIIIITGQCYLATADNKDDSVENQKKTQTEALQIPKEEDSSNKLQLTEVSLSDTSKGKQSTSLDDSKTDEIKISVKETPDELLSTAKDDSTENTNPAVQFQHTFFKVDDLDTKSNSVSGTNSNNNATEIKDEEISDSDNSDINNNEANTVKEMELNSGEIQTWAKDVNSRNNRVEKSTNIKDSESKEEDDNTKKNVNVRIYNNNMESKLTDNSDKADFQSHNENSVDSSSDEYSNQEGVSDSCKNMNLILIIDSSDDVNNNEFVSIKQATTKIANALLSQGNKNRIGIVIYGSRITSMIPLTDNSTQIYRTLETVSPSLGPNKPYLGILAARGELSKSSVLSNSTKAMVYLTSGLKQYVKPAAQQSEMAKKEGMIVIIVGHGHGVVVSDLQNVASSRSMVYVYQSAADVFLKADELSSNICKATRKLKQKNPGNNSNNSDNDSDESDISTSSDRSKSDESDSNDETRDGTMDSNDSTQQSDSNDETRDGTMGSNDSTQQSDSNDETRDGTMGSNDSSQQSDSSNKAVESDGKEGNSNSGESQLDSDDINSSDDSASTTVKETAEEMCKNSKMVYGVGYKKHKTDCEKFIQCYFDEFGKTRASVQTCPFGEFWNHSNAACVQAANADCDNDPCKAPALFSRPSMRSCRSYWSCKNGKSVIMCCPENMSYQSRKGCVVDPNCVDRCPPDDNPEDDSCDKRPLYGKPYLYRQWIESGHWVEMLCPPGTLFDQDDCGCTMRTTYISSLGVRARASETCTPELYLPFCQGLKDWSGKNTLVQNEEDKVLIREGKAYFNGEGSLFIPRFAGSTYGKTIYIKLRYKPDFSKREDDSQGWNTDRNQMQDAPEPREKRSVSLRRRRDSDDANKPTVELKEQSRDISKEPRGHEQNIKPIVAQGEDIGIQGDQNKLGSSLLLINKGDEDTTNSMTKVDGKDDIKENGMKPLQSSDNDKKMDNNRDNKDSGSPDSGSSDRLSSVFETSLYDDANGGDLNYDYNDKDNNRNIVSLKTEDESYFKGWFSNDQNENELNVNVKDTVTAYDIDNVDNDQSMKKYRGDTDNESKETLHRKKQIRGGTRSKINLFEDYSSSESNVKGDDEWNRNDPTEEQKQDNWSDQIEGENEPMKPLLESIKKDSVTSDTSDESSKDSTITYSENSNDNSSDEDDSENNDDRSKNDNDDEDSDDSSNSDNDDDDSDDKSNSDTADSAERGKEDINANGNNWMNIIRESEDKDERNNRITSNAISKHNSESKSFSNIRYFDSTEQLPQSLFEHEDSDIKKEKIQLLDEAEKDRVDFLNQMEEDRIEHLNEMKESNEKVDQESAMALISNGYCKSELNSVCLEDPSLSIGTEGNSTIFAVYASESKKTKIKLNKNNTDDDGWRTATFTINDGVFRVFDNGFTDFEPISGHMKTTFSGIYIGQGTGMKNFKGYIDEVYIYLCQPENIKDFNTLNIPNQHSSADGCDYINKNVVRFYDKDSSEESETRVSKIGR